VALKSICKSLSESLRFALSVSHFNEHFILDPTSLAARMFVSVKRLGFNEWMNIFEQKYPRLENSCLALKGIQQKKGQKLNW